MFCLNFSLQNPIRLLRASHIKDGLNVYASGSTWFKNKFWEFQISLFDPDSLIDLTFDTRMSGRDHAGIRLEFQVLWLFVSFNFYDNRHWNYDENRFYHPGEEDWDHA